MRFSQVLFGSTACFALSIAGAQADVTAQDVWSEWKDVLGQYGTEIDYGIQNQTSSGISVSGTTLSSTIEDGEFSLSFPDLEFTDQSDGTVLITTGDTITGTMTQSPSLGSPTQILFSAILGGFQSIVSGDPINMTNDFSVDKLTLKLDDIRQGDVSFAPQVEMVMEGYTGRSTSTKTDVRTVDQTAAINSVTIDIDVQDPTSQSSFDGLFKVESLTASGVSVVPQDIDMSDPAALFKSGFSSTSDFAYEAMTFDLSTVAEDQTFEATGSNAGGLYAGSFSDQGIDFKSLGRDLAIEAKTSQFPFPILINLEQSASGLKMPLAQTDAPVPFSLDFGLNGFAVNDILWSLFDPTSQLPRDPADVEIGLNGTALWLIDPMDEEAATAATLNGQDVIQLHSLNLNNLIVDIAGANLTGEGAFTFDNTDKVTFDGMPKPTGQLDLEVLGLEALLEKLATLGLLPTEQAMGARMMLGLFARPGDTPDSLTSTLKINDAGEISANGQRIR